MEIVLDHVDGLPLDRLPVDTVTMRPPAHGQDHSHPLLALRLSDERARLPA